MRSPENSNIRLADVSSVSPLSFALKKRGINTRNLCTAEINFQVCSSITFAFLPRRNFLETGS